MQYWNSIGILWEYHKDAFRAEKEAVEDGHVWSIVNCILSLIEKVMKRTCLHVSPNLRFLYDLRKGRILPLLKVNELENSNTTGVPRSWEDSPDQGPGFECGSHRSASLSCPVDHQNHENLCQCFNYQPVSI